MPAVNQIKAKALQFDWAFRLVFSKAVEFNSIYRRCVPNFKWRIAAMKQIIKNNNLKGKQIVDVKVPFSAKQKK